MIFSFSSGPEIKIDFDFHNTDIFCFFHSQNSILLSQELWFSAIVTSLRMKRNVLILESYSEEKITINPSLRWQINDESIWLVPRSLSVLLEATKQISTSYPSLKAYLTTIK